MPVPLQAEVGITDGLQPTHETDATTMNASRPWFTRCTLALPLRAS